MIGSELLQHPGLTIKTVLLILVMFGLNACGKAVDVDELIQEGTRLRESGEIGKAILQYKIAVGHEPERADLRAALAALHIQAGDGASAEKDVLVAIRLGYSELSGAVTLGRAYSARGNPTAIVEGKHLTAFGVSAIDEQIPLDIRVQLLSLEGYAFWQLGNAEASKASYDRAYSLDPNHVDVLVGKALVALLNQDRPDARNWLSKALEGHPNSSFALRNLAGIEKAEGNFAAAEAAFTKAIAGAFNNSDDLFARFLLRLQQRNLEGAAVDLKAFKKKSRRKHLKVYGQGLLAFHEKKFDAAVKSFSEVLSEAPGYLPALTYAGLGNYLLENYEQAVTQLQAVKAQQPGSIEIRRALALAHLKLGDFERARRVGEEILALAPNDKDALQIVGSTALVAGEREEGLRLLQRLSEVKNADPGAKINYGVGLLSDGQFDEGFEQLQSASDITPGSGIQYGVMVFSRLAKGEVAKATEIANEAVAALPENPLGWNLLGGIAISENELAKAKSAFEEVLKIAPGEPSALHNLAGIAITEGNRTQAREYYREVLKVNPKHSRSLFKLAELDLADGNQSAAITKLESALTYDPKDGAARFMLAKLRLQNGDEDAAVEILEELRTEHPENARVPALLASHHLSKNDPQSAITVLIAALRVHPKSALLYNVLGTAYAQAGDGEEAEAAYAQVFRAGAKSPVLQIDSLRSLIHMGSLGIAEKVLVEMKRIHGDYLEDNMLWGMFEMKRGDLTKSKAHFAAVLEKQPQHRESTLLLARAHGRAGEDAKSAEILDSWIASNPTDSQAKFQHGNVMSRLGKTDKAIRSYQDVVDSEPEHILALNNLAMLLREDKPQDALAYAERAVAVKPESAALLDTLGMLQNDQGATEKALRSLSKAVSIAPDNNAIKLNLSIAHMQNGENVRAKELLSEIVRSGEESEVVAKAQEYITRIK